MNVQHRWMVVGIAAVWLWLAPGAASADMMEKDFSGRIARKVDHMKERLALTDDQAQQIRSIFESSHRSTAKSLKAVQARREQTNAQILAVLNDDQKQQYAKLQQEHTTSRKDHQNKGQGQGGWFHQNRKAND